METASTIEGAMHAAWEWLWQQPVRLTSPLLIVGLLSLLALSRSPSSNPGLLMLVFFLYVAGCVTGTYLAVVVASRTLFDVMETMKVSETGILREVLRMPDLSSVLRLLFWHGLKLMLVGLPAMVVLDLLLKAVFRAAMAGVPHDRLALQIAMHSWFMVQSMLMGRYAFAIPLMVLGETSAKAAINRSRTAVRMMGWRIELLAGSEYVVLILPNALLRATGHATLVAKGESWVAALGVELYHAFVGTWFVLGMALLARDVVQGGGTVPDARCRRAMTIASR